MAAHYGRALIKASMASSSEVGTRRNTLRVCSGWVLMTADSAGVSRPDEHLPLRREPENTTEMESVVRVAATGYGWLL